MALGPARVLRATGKQAFHGIEKRGIQDFRTGPFANAQNREVRRRAALQLRAQRILSYHIGVSQDFPVRLGRRQVYS